MPVDWMNEVPVWITSVAIPLAVVLFGGGGLAAILRARSDAKIGVADQENAEEDSQSDRWKAIIEVQTRAVIEPLERKVAALDSKVTAQDQEIQSLKALLEEATSRYWKAVGYIRTLITWINRNTPEDVLERTDVPDPHDDLAKDL